MAVPMLNYRPEAQLVSVVNQHPATSAALLVALARALSRQVAASARLGCPAQAGAEAALCGYQALAHGVVGLAQAHIGRAMREADLTIPVYAVHEGPCVRALPVDLVAAE